jgi:hypothetical protein
MPRPRFHRRASGRPFPVGNVGGIGVACGAPFEAHHPTTLINNGQYWGITSVRDRFVTHPAALTPRPSLIRRLVVPLLAVLVHMRLPYSDYMNRSPQVRRRQAHGHRLGLLPPTRHIFCLHNHGQTTPQPAPRQRTTIKTRRNFGLADLGLSTHGTLFHCTTPEKEARQALFVDYFIEI